VPFMILTGQFFMGSLPLTIIISKVSPNSVFFEVASKPDFDQSQNGHGTLKIRLLIL